MGIAKLIRQNKINKKKSQKTSQRLTSILQEGAVLQGANASPEPAQVPLHDLEKQQADQEKWGPSLVEHLVDLTGLPKAIIKREFQKILEEAGHQPGQDVSLDQLRKAMMVYLNRVYSQIQDNAPRIFRQ